MATKNNLTVEAVCLCRCSFGECGEVVSLLANDAKAGIEQGVLDGNAAAIAYAKEQK